MTREEAIKILKSWSTFAYDEKEAGEFCEAYDMAIKALEAQDVDAVSRQAVMWMLTNIKYTHCGTAGQADVIDTAKTMVNAMPSAQADNSCDGCKYENADDGVLVPCGFCKRSHSDNYERRTDE